MLQVYISRTVLVLSLTNNNCMQYLPMTIYSVCMHTSVCVCVFTYTYALVPKGVQRTKGVENKVDDTLKLAVFLECAQC